jgi:hypothetical protein
MRTFWQIGKAILSNVSEAQKALKYQKQVFSLVSERVPYWKQTLLNDSQLARLCDREIQLSYSFDRSVEVCASFIQDMITA